eukprot:1156832-Pelagomonas_calceolata.AAC.5
MHWIKTKKGHSAGEYKSSLKHGVSNKFRTSWLQENDRHLWLEDYGMDVDSVYKAGCKWRESVFNCHCDDISSRPTSRVSSTEPRSSSRSNSIKSSSSSSRLLPARSPHKAQYRAWHGTAALY